MRIKLDKGAYVPVRAHDSDAGLDLRSPIDAVIPARGSAIIDTLVHIALPRGTVGMLKSKSGLNVLQNITSEGVIDESYRGSIVCKLYNHGDTEVRIKSGQKITQLVILPVVISDLTQVDALDDTERGSNGFGSSGE